MEEVTLSVDFLIGAILGFGIPTLLWAVKMYSMTKQLRDMHLEPDAFNFGNIATHKMMADHFREEEDYHREFIESTKRTRYVIRELSHFMKWMVKTHTGQDPPPYIPDDL